MLGKDSILDSIDLEKDPPFLVRAKLLQYKNEISVYRIKFWNDGNQEALDELDKHEEMVDGVLVKLERGEYTV